LNDFFGSRSVRRIAFALPTSLLPAEPFGFDPTFWLPPRRAVAERGIVGMSDRTLTCRDCGQPFTFTSGEQAFYLERGYSEPQRCASCRAERKAQRAASGGGYGNGGGNYGNSSGGYGGGSRGGNSSGPRQMYPAVCSACGKETEVPFQPSSDKPVYCRECFQERRPARPRYGAY
jgi:CxxC-x17-CxxC domain-containing protein